MMKVVLALALGAATAFVGPVAGPTAATVVNGKAEMVELAETNPDFLGRTIGFWDPFNLIEEGDFWGLGNEGTIGYRRCADLPLTSRGDDAAAATWIFSGDGSRHRRGCHVDIPRRRVAPLP